MATNRSDWPAILSEELPEGLSSSGRENEENATTSRHVSSRQPRVPKRWFVYSYFSKLNAESIDRIRSRYQVPGMSSSGYPI
jgi:hypothetical protein